MAYNMGGYLGTNPVQQPAYKSPFQTFQPTNFNTANSAKFPAQTTQNMTMQAGPTASATPLWEPAQTTQNMTMQAGPTASANPVWEPAKVDNMSFGSGAGSTMPFAAADPVAGYDQPQTNQSPDFNFTMDDLLKYMGQTDMPTMDQITMDPSYQFQQQQGINALDSSAAARGGLLSSGHTKDIQDYAQGLASQEYGKAYDRFQNNRAFKASQLGNAFQMLDANRKFGAGRFDTGVQQDQVQQGLDQSAYQYGNDFSYKTFFDMMSDYNKRMDGSQNTDAGLAGSGVDSTNKAVDTTMSTGDNIANIYALMAKLNAGTTTGTGAANNNLVSTLLTMILGGS